MHKLAIALALCGTALFAFPAQEPAAKNPALPVVGEAAPTFTVNNSKGVSTPVGAAETWTVLAFFPKAATPG